ncbi:Rho GTPase-activating protein 18 [Dissostichus eleginoides]|uniref:Rho GTPase-activating protein 18 n=1 Tax=Dissostichus eleginoides TaxID=100907 RepID=A0AAD9BK25_DISEL|nr:Rho GTPase-activating protein 18 [Dissostichus eleginoides]
MLSPPTSSSAPPHVVTSNPRPVTMETYWREVKSIEEEKEGEEEEEEEEERKSMDEVELEEAWLTEAGLSSLFTGSSYQEESPPAEALLSTLSRQQAATVRRRLDNYNETLKLRNRQPIRDVRDVFTEPDDESAERSPSPPAHHIESQPVRYHTSTKTIHRNPHTGTCLYVVLLVVLLSDRLFLRSSLRIIYQNTQGVAEHKRGGACWDCLRFHGDDSDELQGLTCADDLSSCDLTRLGFISHIELHTFLLALGVQTKHSRAPRHRSREGGVFAVPLESLLENDRKTCPGVKVPVVFQKSRPACRQKGFSEELDRCSSGGFDWSSVRQVDAAGLLKLFIRELPTPLLTHTHLSTYRAVLGVSSVLHQVQALQLLTLLLPEANRETLRVVSHQDQNRMSLWNVSMVMAPNLFTCHRRGNKHFLSKQQEMEEAVGGAHLVRLMVAHLDVLWTVPTFLLSQVRQMNQASNQKQLGLTKAKRRLLRVNPHCDWLIKP